MSAARSAGAAAFFECLVDAGARRGKGRNEPALQASQKSQTQGKGNHLPVERDGTDARKRLRKKTEAETQEEYRERKAKQSTTSAEQQRLDKGVAQNSRMA